MLLLLSEAATGGVLWKKAFLEISRISVEGASFGTSSQLSYRPDNLRLSCRVSEVFAGAYFKEHRRTTAPILLWIRLTVFHALIWCAFNIIFNHFTCYLSISRDQLSSVFSWSLAYLARALIMFLCFFFLCVTITLHHTKFRLVRLLCTTCASHGSISQLPKDSSPSLFCPCYNWRWTSDYTNERMKCKWNKFDYATLINYVCKFLLSVFYSSA